MAPFALAFDASGQYVYVINNLSTGAAGVSQYAIGSGGGLQALTPSTATSGNGPTSIASGR
jgi:hypothetical protein